MRQQLQANARYLIGLREEPVDFGLAAVSSADCADCHERPSDRHPIYRFLEPRFARARTELHPERCLSCHLEHTGRRVTVENGFCRHCHENLEVLDDPIEPPHERLVESGAWTSCLRCHDFHGNHEEDPPARLADGVRAEQIDRYFKGGPSPWTGAKRHAAKPRRSK